MQTESWKEARTSVTIDLEHFQGGAKFPGLVRSFLGWSRMRIPSGLRKRSPRSVQDCRGAVSRRRSHRADRLALRMDRRLALMRALAHGLFLQQLQDSNPGFRAQDAADMGGILCGAHEVVL